MRWKNDGHCYVENETDELTQSSHDGPSSSLIRISQGRSDSGS